MFAVFKTGGKQYRVAAEDVLKVDKVKGEPGEIVEFGEVLVVGGDSVTLGAPTVAGATVAAEVLDQGRGRKIIAFKKRRRKNSRRKRGHRQEFTLHPHHRDPDRGAEGEQNAAAASEARAGSEARGDLRTLRQRPAARKPPKSHQGLRPRRKARAKGRRRQGEETRGVRRKRVNPAIEEKK